MTVRDTIHQRIDLLDDDQLARLLTIIDEIALERRAEPSTPAGGSLRSLIGIGHSAEWTNIVEHKDDYLANASDANRR